MDYLLALVSGVLLALSFPRFGHPAFAWIALAPLLLALTAWRGPMRRVSGQPPLRAFTLGLTSGVVYFAGTLYWTGTVIRTFGGVAWPVAMLAVLLLASYLALYPAITALITSRLINRMGIGGLLFAPAAWVSTEFARGQLFSGFPWVPLGSSQVEVLPVVQLASVFGVYGISWLVASINMLSVYALLTAGRRRYIAIGTAVIALVTTGVWGTLRIADSTLTREGTPIRVGVVQPNIAQTDKWNPGEARRIFTTHVAMTRDLVRRGAEYVLWPESATPFLFEEDPEGQAAVRALAREVRVPILFGSDEIVRTGTPRMYNAAFLVGPTGETAAVYRKIHLVPFGEFIPLQRWLTFASPLVESLAEFAPGDAVVLLPVGSHLTSTAICYEVVFPSLAREAVIGGSELLTAITNDGWYGESSAPYQHFALASMRAVEQGRYLVRAANTGISGVVDPYGRIVRRAAIFEQVGIVEEARFLTSRTVYSAIGDVVAYVAVALIVVALVTVGRTR